MTKLRWLALAGLTYAAYPFVVVGVSTTLLGVGFVLGLYDLVGGRRSTIFNGAVILYKGDGEQDQEMNKSDKDYPALVAMIKAQHADGVDALIIMGKDQETAAAALREDFPGHLRVAVVTNPNNPIPRVLVRREPVPET